jgi:hypothetical protein
LGGEGRTYQEHERGEKEEPKVIRFTVRERRFFEHATITHAICGNASKLNKVRALVKRSWNGTDSQKEEVEDKVQGYGTKVEERGEYPP